MYIYYTLKLMLEKSPFKIETKIRGKIDKNKSSVA